MKNSKELIELLNLSKIDNTNFSGESVTIGSTIVFGGQVLAQA
ncbi:MAG: acyl-CoA thioesterase-2, partial [Paraglaciecola sp.]